MVAFGASERFSLPCRGSSPLSRTIESEVIPRLMLTLRCASNAAPPSTDTYIPSERDVREVVSQVLAKDAAITVAFVGVLRARGASLQSIYLDLLAPAARLLGTMWEQDEADFSAVTLGVGRLHQVLHACSPGIGSGPFEESVCGARALMVTVPGEQHTFGALMVSDFLRRIGFDVWNPMVPTEAALDEIIDRRGFDLIGFSMSASRHLDRLTSCIARIRGTTRNGGARVLVGGSLFAGHPELVAQVGADGTAADGLEAATVAKRMVLQSE